MRTPDAQQSVTEQRPRTFVPRQAADEASVSALLGRAAACFQLGTETLTAAFVHGTLDELWSAARGAPLARLIWTLDGVKSEILLPVAVVIGLVAPLEQTPDGGLDWNTAPLLLELLLAPHLDQAEMLLGQSIQLQALKEMSVLREVEASACVAVRGSVSGAPFAAWLRLAPNALEAAVQVARRLTRARQLVPDPPVVFAVRIGLAQIGAGALASARVGDAILIEAGRIPPGKVAVVIGESRMAVADWMDGVVTLTEAPRLAGPFDLGGWTMQDQQEGDPVAATFGDLRITLVFELGRRLVTLEEVRGMVQGQVINLGRDEASPVDILANGARLGRGEIIKVGDALAVRVTGLNT